MRSSFLILPPRAFKQAPGPSRAPMHLTCLAAPTPSRTSFLYGLVGGSQQHMVQQISGARLRANLRPPGPCRGGRRSGRAGGNQRAPAPQREKPLSTVTPSYRWSSGMWTRAARREPTLRGCCQTVSYTSNLFPRWLVGDTSQRTAQLLFPRLSQMSDKSCSGSDRWRAARLTL
jgi:hypothetical protein